MSDFLGELTPVAKGDDVRYVASAGRINAIQEVLRLLWAGENIRDEAGQFVSRGRGGVGIRMRRARRSGVVSKGCIPWTPRYVNEGTVDDPDWKIYLDIGTINGVLNDDWNQPLSLAAYDNLYYIVATVSFTDGEVSQIDYSLESVIPAAGDLDPMSKSVLPSTLEIILGTVKEGVACMAWNQNLSVESFDALHEPKSTVTLGELPYHIWWKYIVKGL